ncbi:MAG: hypothetical protein KGN39_09425 [Betaproteobacteria bacterium]|nr:hypothetical protein [Betaproteobacteria bacterium]
MSSQWIPLDEARAGMCLADDLRDGNGQMLLPKGTELAESTLKSLARRGIEQVPVVVEAVVDEEALAARREAARQRLQHLFRLAQDSTSQALLHLMLEYRTERLG